MDLIDVSRWRIDDRFSPYPEGSRDKSALISPADCDAPGIIPNHRYLLKFSNPRYPPQFWSEIIAFKIAELMGVPAPHCFLAFDPETRQPASLSCWFYGEEIESELPIDPLPTAQAPDAGETRDILAPSDAPETFSLYVPGSSYMARFIKDYDFAKGRQHNLRTLRNFVGRLRIRYGVDYWPLWSMIFTFDTLIGNTDRHQDNWGVLWRRNTTGMLVPRFSPAFDNGTSLLHEILDRRLQAFADPEFRERYIRRGKHHIRLERDSPEQFRHLELLRQLATDTPTLVRYMRGCLDFDPDEMRAQIESLCDIDCAVPLTPERARAIAAIVLHRRQLILTELLND